MDTPPFFFLCDCSLWLILYIFFCLLFFFFIFWFAFLSPCRCVFYYDCIFLSFPPSFFSFASTDLFISPNSRPRPSTQTNSLANQALDLPTYIHAYIHTYTHTFKESTQPLLPHTWPTKPPRPAPSPLLLARIEYLSSLAIYLSILTWRLVLPALRSHIILHTRLLACRLPISWVHNLITLYFLFLAGFPPRLPNQKSPRNSPVTDIWSRLISAKPPVCVSTPLDCATSWLTLPPKKGYIPKQTKKRKGILPTNIHKQSRTLGPHQRIFYYFTGRRYIPVRAP